MEEAPRAPKSLIPKRAQLPLVIIGVIGLLVVLWDTANRMGWIGGPPRAKAPKSESKTADTTGGATASQTQPGSSTPQPASTQAPIRPRQGAPTDLDTLRPPARDPMAQLTTMAPPTQPAPKPAIQTSPPRTSEAPPLPPPMPTPGHAASEFPSPLTAQPAPSAVPKPAALVAPSPQPVPSALARAYPMARRGSRETAPSSNLTLVGTIHGSRGAIAVVHPNDSPRGHYLRPGETLYGGRERVEAIGAGKVHISGGAGERELTLRPRSTATQPKPEETSPRAEKGGSASLSGETAGLKQ